MSDDERAQSLSVELEMAFRNRGDLYRLLYEELVGRFGPAEAEEVLTRTIERRGREVAAAFAGYRADQAREIGEAFLAVSPDGGRMYPTEVTRHADGISFRVTRCPLKEAWRAAGVDDSRLETLCRIAGAFDRGLFEATGVRFENRTWCVGDGDHCCTIALRNG